jgi:hypothetical protein
MRKAREGARGMEIMMHPMFVSRAARHAHRERLGQGQRPTRTASLWLLVALLVAAMSACERGAESAGSGIPTAGGGTEAAAATSSVPAAGPVDPSDAALAYAQCVRDAGFPDWPDPDTDGRMRIRMGPGTGIDQNDPRLHAAMTACQDLRPEGMGGSAGAPDPEAVERALAFAQCMRENGVPEFPDPDAEGGIATGGGGRAIVGPGQGGIDRGDPRVQAAMRVCGESMPGVVVR